MYILVMYKYIRYVQILFVMYQINIKDLFPERHYKENQIKNKIY